MFYYKIVPLEKLNTEKFPAFTYSSEEEIPPYSLVKIGLRKRSVQGIVWSATSRPLFPTKKVQAVLEENFLKDQQIQLAKKISSYYLLPFNESLKLFFPPQVRKKNKKEKTIDSSLEKIGKQTKKLLPTFEQKKALKKMALSKNKNFLLFGPASSGKTLLAWEIAKKVLRKKQQVLVVLPEIFLAHQEVERWKKWLSLKEEEIFFVHSSQKKTNYRDSWEKIKNNQIKLIIGSRSGLFLPFSDLGLIVLDEEQDPSHKQWDRPPFYNAKKIILDLAQIFSAQSVFLSATPTPESFSNKKLEKITLPRLKTKNWEVKKPQIILADLKKNFFARNKSPLSIELKTQLEKVFSEKKMAFLFVPQRGFGRKIICTDCRKPLLCPNCKINLTDLGESYRCLKCNHQRSPFLACPHCRSFRLKSLGIGTEKIAREIKTLFPQKNIFIADQKFFQKETDRKKTWEALKERKIDILVGTQAIIKGFDLPFLALTATLEAENFVGENDFRFDERKMGTFFQLAGRINRPGSDQKGAFLLQTFQPENPLWKFLDKMDWQDWLEKELENRHATQYPPFCFLTKLSFVDKTSPAVEKMTKKMYTALSRDDFDKKLLSVSLFPDSPRQFFKGWKKNLILKTTQPISVIEPLQKLLKKTLASGKMTVDVDPENIF